MHVIAWTARLSASGNPSFPFSASGFVCGCCGDFPLLQPVYSGRSTASVAGSCWVQSQAPPFAIYNHHLVISPDHVSQISFEGWGLLFQVTAYLMLIVDGLGCWIGVLALRTIQPPDKAI